MKFKRYGAGNFGLILIEIIILGTTVFLCLDGINVVFIIYMAGLMLFAFLLFYIVKPAAFSDYVVCSEDSVSIITKEKRYTYNWNEIRTIQAIRGGKSGGISGWDIVPHNGEPIFISPFSARFIKYVITNHPNIEVAYYGGRSPFDNRHA